MSDFVPILDFWFKDAETNTSAANRRWFGASRTTDKAILSNFSEAVVAALAGDHARWAEQARGRLALILLLDQFTRNMYRGTAQAFAGDARAVTLCRSGLAANMAQDLNLFERAFFLMPLQHSELLKDQDAAISHFEALAETAPRHLTRAIKTFAGHAREHREIINRFGRFPHRNAPLGRSSTPAEEIYLVDGPTYGQ